MQRLDELKAEMAKMKQTREDASWQDFHLPRGFWLRYREVEELIKQQEAKQR